MRQLLFGSVMCVLASGCVIEGEGRGGGGGTDHANVTVSWQLRNAADGAQTACPDGYFTAAVNSVPVDDEGAPAGLPILDLFDCDSNVGSTAPLYPDRYLVWVDIETDDGTEVYAKSLSQLADVTVKDRRIDTTILNDGGYFELSWDLVGAQSNAPLACAEVPDLDAIESISTDVASSTRAYDDKFTCEDHFGVTAGLLQGSYTVSIDALRNGQSIGTAPALASRAIHGQNRVTDLGHVSIPIAGL